MPHDPQVDSASLCHWTSDDASASMYVRRLSPGRGIGFHEQEYQWRRFESCNSRFASNKFADSNRLSATRVFACEAQFARAYSAKRATKFPGNLEKEGAPGSGGRPNPPCNIVLRVCVISVVVRLRFVPRKKPDSLVWTMLVIRSTRRGWERSRVVFLASGF